MNDKELLARSISQFRRTIIRDFIFVVVHTFEDFDYSLPQMATLLLLDEEGELTIKQVAELLREDERDRRAKRVAITERGQTLIATLEQRRADAQIAVMEYLSAEEQAEVRRAMALLAEAGMRRRKQDESSEAGTGAR